MQRIKTLIKSNSMVIGAVGFVLLMAGSGLYFAQPDKKWWIVSIAVGFGLWLLLIVSNFKDILRYLLTQRGKMGTNAVISSLFFIAVLTLVVYISDRHNSNLDWTKAKRHTLSPQTAKIVRKLKKNVTAIGFYNVNSQDFFRVRNLLKRYEELSPKIKAQVVDPRKELGLARRYEPISIGTVVFEVNGKQEKVQFGGEKEFTGAIFKLISEKEPTVYFLQGHGEHRYDGFDETGYGVLKRELERLNYQVRELKLMAMEEVPKDCNVLVIGGARKDLLQQEKKAIQTYVNKGGRLLLMLEPDPSPNFKDWLTEWGLETKKGIVIEPTNNVLGNPVAVFAFNFLSHDITQPFQKSNREAVLFVTPIPIKQKNQLPSGLSLTKLVETTPVSWREESLQAKKDLNEESGPFVLASAIEKSHTEKKKSRIIVLSDSDFCTNNLVANLINGEFVVNCIHWLAEEDVLIEIPPKDEPPNTLMLMRQQEVFTFFWGIIVLPLAILLSGLFGWWSRRR